MNRMTQAQAEVVSEALSYVPARLRPLVECDVFCGDPLFAGISQPEWAMEESQPGRSYRELAHVCFPYHVKDRRATMVFPRLYPVATVLHELGHVLHWSLQERAGGWDCVPRFDAVSDYAETNVLEEFAEAWIQWFYSPRCVEDDDYWTSWSRANGEFFDRLCAA